MLTSQIGIAVLAFGLTVAAASQSAPSGQIANEIPVQFRGEWNENPADCGTSNNDSKLIITADELRFWESTGEARKIVIHNKRAITVTASHAGEGQVWDSTSTYVLSGSLNDLTMDGTYTRHRCPIQ